MTRRERTRRAARARATVRLSAAALARLRERAATPDDPLAAARVAGVLAAKETARAVPDRPAAPLEHVRVELSPGEGTVEIEVEAAAVARVGVGTEALHAAAVAAVALLDALRDVDPDGSVEVLRVVERSGGPGDFREEDGRTFRAAVLVTSDRVAAGEKDDAAGRRIAARLADEGIEVAALAVLPDDRAAIAERLAAWADGDGLDLVLTTGGTGLEPRDATPEATRDVIEREAPGIPDALRRHGGERTPYAMLSRSVAGVRGRTLIVNLPGSRRGVEEALDALFPGLHHGLRMLG